MKPGSLVGCIDETYCPEILSTKKVYTCLRTVKKGENIGTKLSQVIVLADCIFIEEVKNNVPKPRELESIEMPFALSKFRELMPTMEISIPEANELQLV